MIALIRQWLTQVVFCTFLLALMQALIPDCAIKKTAGFAGGLALLLCILQPILRMEFRGLDLDLSEVQEEVQTQMAFLEHENQKILEARIAEETASYILEQAKQLGVSVSVSAETSVREDGIIYPAAVHVSGPYIQTLADCIEADLGIPPERQVWGE